MKIEPLTSRDGRELKLFQMYTNSVAFFWEKAETIDIKVSRRSDKNKRRNSALFKSFN